MIGFEIVSSSKNITEYAVREDGITLLGGIIEAKPPGGQNALIAYLYQRKN